MKGNHSSNRLHHTDQLMSALILGVQSDGHVVYDLPHSVRRQKAGHQHVALRVIELLVGHALGFRRDLEPPTLLVVEDGGENAW